MISSDGFRGKAGLPSLLASKLHSKAADARQALAKNWNYVQGSLGATTILEFDQESGSISGSRWALFGQTGTSVRVKTSSLWADSGDKDTFISFSLPALELFKFHNEGESRNISKWVSYTDLKELTEVKMENPTSTAVSCNPEEMERICPGFGNGFAIRVACFPIEIGTMAVVASIIGMDEEHLLALCQSKELELNDAKIPSVGIKLGGKYYLNSKWIVNILPMKQTRIL